MLERFTKTRYDTPPDSTLSVDPSLSTDLSFHKVECLLRTDHIDATRLVDITDTVALFRNQQHFRTECRADELTMLRRLGEHVCHGGAVLRVEVCIDFVKQVKRRRV